MCATCKGLEYLRADVNPGHPLFGKLEPCPACRGKLEAEALQQNMTATSGLLPGELGLTLDDILDRGEGSQQMITEARRMLARPYGMLTLWGGPGNGKSKVLQVLVNEFMRTGRPASYARLADLLDYLREGFQEGVPLNAGARYKKIAALKLLCLDEVDKPRMTDWAREILFTLLDDRYRYGREQGDLQKHTVLALNHNPVETFDSYIVSRLRYDLLGPDGFRIVYNGDPDAREEGL